ncbi:MAG TPA: integrase arm-type DNA-binding domain-containing protein [Paenalcaligenes sp.]|nr:integrase arm-type DNA-binding domain-containing protein [Paenalcaligenes sp.]
MLTVRQINSALAKDKPYWLRDGDSLYLYVTPAGSKLWRYRYRIGDKAGVYALGNYPEVDLKTARLQLEHARALVRQGIHPLTDKRIRLNQQVRNNHHTFESVALDWIASNTDWSPTYTAQVESYMKRDVFPAIGKLPISSITVSHLHPLIQSLSQRGAVIAMTVRQWLSQVFHYAAQQGLCGVDPAAMLKRVIKRPPVRHNPPLPWHEIPIFMRKLESWNGTSITRTALLLAALTFVRTIELRRATWDQFNPDSATWTIPAANMKMRRPHIVPLSKQVLTLLKSLQKHTGTQTYLLPNSRHPDQPIGPTTLNNTIRALGYKGQFSTHGFRSTATTVLSLLSYPENRVDLQLAHTKKCNPSRAPYDHTKYISSRRVIMQDWADIWDALSEGQNLEAVTRQFGPLSKRRKALLSIVEREQ